MSVFWHVDLVASEVPFETHMVTYVKVGGLVIKIEHLYQKTKLLLGGYIIDASLQKADVSISITYEDVEKEYMQTQDGSFLISSKSTYYFFNREKHELLAIQRKLANIIPQYNLFLLHGAVVAVDNQGYLFTANSGVGKSTRASLWLQEIPNSFIINGDKPFIQITDEHVLVYGTPWCGKEGWNTNTAVPLRAIFILNRVNEGSKTTIQEEKMGNAFTKLLEQSYKPIASDMMKKTMQLIKGLEGRTKIYTFNSEPTAEAIRLAYETARPR